jgi:hypothetical protein
VREEKEGEKKGERTRGRNVVKKFKKIPEPKVESEPKVSKKQYFSFSSQMFVFSK